MKHLKQLAALLVALMLVITALPLYAEGAGEAPQDDAATEQREQPTEEGPAEETEPAAETATPEPQPYATMAPTKKEDMPARNKEAKAEAIVTDKEGSALFEAPSHGSAVLANLEAGSVVELLILGQAWCKIKSGSNQGYVPTYSLSFAFGASQPALALVTAPNGKLSLRESMTTKSKAVGTVKSGQMVVLLAKGETFSLVRHGNKEGYALTAHLKEVPPSTALGNYTEVISTAKNREANVRLRSEPSTKGREYTKVKSGLFVVVLDIKDDWAQVEYEGYHGYMMAEFLKSFD